MGLKPRRGAHGDNKQKCSCPQPYPPTAGQVRCLSLSCCAHWPGCIVFCLHDWREGPDRLREVFLSPASFSWAQPAPRVLRASEAARHHRRAASTTRPPKYLCTHVSTALGFGRQPTDREVITALTLAFPNFWVLNSAPLKNNKQTAHVLMIICTKPLAFKQLCCLPSPGCGHLLPAADDNFNYPAFKYRSQDIQFPPAEQGT